MRTFEHLSRRERREAIAQLDAIDSGETQLIAGGTDLLPLMKAGLIAPTRLIDLKPPSASARISLQDDGALRLGALTTLADVERERQVRRRGLPLLVQAVRDAATPQLRTMATVGGNLLQQHRCWYYRGGQDCWLAGGAECFARDGENEYHAIFQQSPCVAVHPSDLAPALIALDATVRWRPSLARANCRSPISSRRRPTSAAWSIVRPGRVDHAVQRSGAVSASRGVYLKAMERQAWAFALVSVAAQMTLEGDFVRRGSCSVASPTRRAPREAEAALVGRRSRASLPPRRRARGQGATPLSKNGYKVRLARELTRRRCCWPPDASRSYRQAGTSWAGSCT